MNFNDFFTGAAFFVFGLLMLLYVIRQPNPFRDNDNGNAMLPQVYISLWMVSIFSIIFGLGYIISSLP